MGKAYLNTISTAVPDYDIHKRFVEFAPSLLKNKRQSDLFSRMADRANIDHRYSLLQPADNPLNLDTNFYISDPSTQHRMDFYEKHAFTLARKALDKLDLNCITHIIFTTCTGFYAPGIDWQIIRHYGLNPSIERTVIGFMGCFAAVNALKLARHIIRSEQSAYVLVVNLELCTIHMQRTDSLEKILSFLIFADGCAAGIVSAKRMGLELQSFSSTFLTDTPDHITWHIGNSGFDMALKGEVPHEISAALVKNGNALLAGREIPEIRHWAVHPGGRSILDAVQEGLGLKNDALHISRDILRRYGNMSSASLMFVLKEILDKPDSSGDGCGLAFGPGLTVESMIFKKE